MQRSIAFRAIATAMVAGCLGTLPAAALFGQAPPPPPGPQAPAPQAPAPQAPAPQEPAPQAPAPQAPVPPPPGPQAPAPQPTAAQPTQPAQQTPPAPAVQTPANGADAAVPPAFAGQSIFNSTPPFLTSVAVDHSNLIYRDGETLAVQVKAERDAHLYVFYHQCDGQSLLMFPNEARQANRVPAGQVVTIPGEGDRFKIRIQAPLGNDTLQVIASIEPLAELDALVQKAGRAPVVSNELLKQLGERLSADKNKWTEHRLPIQTVAKAAEAAPRQPARFGLFVGVGQLQDESRFAPRTELGHSAEVLAQAFIQRGQLAANGSKLLLGNQATRANVEDAITKWLAAATQPGDTVFISFSGFGETVPAAAGPDNKPRNELFLVPYDNRFTSTPQNRDELLARLHESMIFPDTLARWLLALPNRRIVLILDVCSLDLSGSAPPASTASKSAEAPARLKDAAAINLVILNGDSRPKPLYFSREAPGSTWLAHFLAESMSKLPAPVTLQQAFDHYRQGWRHEIGANPDRADEPSLQSLADDGPAVELVPAAAASAPR